MTCEHLGQLLVFVSLCAMGAAAAVAGAQDFDRRKVSIMQHVEPTNPKCFAGGRRDFTCFWEEDEERAGSVDQYNFTYTYQSEKSNRCLLRSFPSAGRKRLFLCHLNRTQMFVDMDIKVHKDGVLVLNRSLLVELVFLLDPPANVTVNRTGQQGQLSVSWVPPPLKYMDDSMMYEVSYAAEGSHLVQVEEVRATSEIILRGLLPGTNYKICVRVKLDGISYSGYWSSWSDAVVMETLPAELNLIIVSLSVIISLILLVLSLTLILSHRRYLMNKIWPDIPNPESKFPGLFNIYGGNFQEWLGQTSGALWLTPAFFYAEERPSSLEVLSEINLIPSLPLPPTPPSRKASVAFSADRKQGGDTQEDTAGQPHRGSAHTASLKGQGEETPHEHWLMGRLRELHRTIPRSQSSLMESQDAYITLSSNILSEDEHLDGHLEETLPLEVLFAFRQTKLSESHSDLGSAQHSSGSGRLSSQSSFDYPSHTWPPTSPGYTYMGVTDSGVSMDYSPVSANRVDDVGKVVIYANDFWSKIPAQRRPFLTQEHPVNNGC